jgi:hypothetical protein
LPPLLQRTVVNRRAKALIFLECHYERQLISLSEFANIAATYLPLMCIFGLPPTLREPNGAITFRLLSLAKSLSIL